MLFAYIDETGDTGDASKSGSSQCFALGCVLVEDKNWPATFDGLLEMRRGLKTTYGIRVRDELKANYLIRGSSHLRPLNIAPEHRGFIYRAHLRAIADLNARAFSIVVDKQKTGLSGNACFETAWEMLLQRLERTTYYEDTYAMLIHDEGENEGVRKQVRKARRHLTAGLMGGGSVQVNATRILEDPSPRASHHSYLIQIADMVAYAGWRSYTPPSSSVARIVPGTMWNEIGTGIHSRVNALSGGTPGVVVRKK